MFILYKAKEMFEDGELVDVEYEDVGHFDDRASLNKEIFNLPPRTAHRYHIKEWDFNPYLYPLKARIINRYNLAERTGRR